jgi:hypothetical protein
MSIVDRMASGGRCWPLDFKATPAVQIFVPCRSRRTDESTSPRLDCEALARLDHLNDQLRKVELWIDGWASWLHGHLSLDGPSAPSRLSSWRLSACVTLELDPTDPTCAGEDHRVLCQIEGDIAHHESASAPRFPEIDWRDAGSEWDLPTIVPQCWLFRTLLDHAGASTVVDALTRTMTAWCELALHLPCGLAMQGEDAPTARHGNRIMTAGMSPFRPVPVYPQLLPPTNDHLHEFNASDINQLIELNRLLADVEEHSLDCADWLHVCLADGAENRPAMEDDAWDVDVQLHFVLQRRDALRRDGDENVIHELSEWAAYARSGTLHRNFEPPVDQGPSTWNEFEQSEAHPLRRQPHCWLFRSLCDQSDPRLGWNNILRIGSVRTDASVRWTKCQPIFGEQR